MIRRSEHSASKKFSIISRSLLQNKKLSFQARGLLAYVLSKPSRWEAKDADIMREGGIKECAYNSILDELKAAGYAVRNRVRKANGTFGFSLEIFEEPQKPNKTPLPDYPVVDEPVVDSQVVAIDSTCADATTNQLINENKEIKRPVKKSYKPSAPVIELTPPFQSERFLSTLAAFERHRKSVHRPLTDDARVLIYFEMGEMGESDAVEGMKAAIKNGWLGIKYEKSNGNGHSSGNGVGANGLPKVKITTPAELERMLRS